MRHLLILLLTLVCTSAFAARYTPEDENDTLVVTFRAGWNLFSSSVLPANRDIQTIFTPLMESGRLVRIRDESGLSLENFGTLGGWINFIGNLNPAEGYQVRVNGSCQIILIGQPAQFPFPIPLRKGWNIIGYPGNSDRDGMKVIRQLIDRGTLLRVEDENAASIAPDGTVWKNGIGNFSPGKGYKVLVSADDILTIPGWPLLQTLPVTDITLSTATGGGTVTSDGGDPVTERGVCWSTSDPPTVSGSKTVSGSGTGSFTAGLTGLAANTVYYARAYATNSLGTSYGLSVKFATRPSVTTGVISRIMTTSASGGGSVSAGGGASITARGLCWNTTGTPIVTDLHTVEGNGPGSFSASLTGLSPLTTYYVRAYATNLSGTAYGEQLTFTTTPLAADIDGNGYHTVSIGNKIWMAENLRTTRYRNGTSIGLITDNTAWAAMTVGARCWYNNDTVYKNSYGGLYNWHALAGTNALCPEGWHIPSETEWLQLVDLLGGDLVAGGKLKEKGTAHWNAPNTGATDETGFSALGGGIRGGFGAFYNIGNLGYYWSSTPFNATLSVTLGLYFDDAGAGVSYLPKEFGVSVRCVKD